MNSIEGSFSGKGLKIAIVCGRFNELITSKLLGACEDGLIRHDVKSSDIDVAWVPGAFEMPLVAQALANTKKYDGIITLGAVIRGSTPHFDYVCSEVAKGISRINLDTGIPVIFGVLTTNSIEQAIERAGTKAGNKGFDCAMAVLEMANLVKQI